METKITDTGIYTGTLKTNQLLAGSVAGFKDVEKLENLQPSLIDDEGVYTGGERG